MSIVYNGSEKSQRIGLSDEAYPESLRQIDSPPQAINVRGAPLETWLDRPKVAIVGSRKASPYGKLVTDELATGLARRGVVIISGLALGIDAIAHRATLACGGTTVAILPTPLNQIYPASHLGLAADIVARSGSLISEYESDSEVFKVNFIARNRIVSGLADILLITEAAAASGTMHTARFALGQGKTVMAVPGNINQDGSQGTNNLIKSGAVPVTELGDILFALGIPINHEAPLDRLMSELQTTILRLINEGLADQEDLAERINLTPYQLSSELTMMEIAGTIRPLGAGRWSAS
jgi:DNA processing protein